MKIKVVPLFTTDEGTQYVVVVKQGVQSFHVYPYSYNKGNCLYMAKMFRKALRAHDAARDARKGKR